MANDKHIKLLFLIIVDKKCNQRVLTIKFKFIRWLTIIICGQKKYYLYLQERQEDLKIAMDASVHVSPRAKATMESLERAKRELSSHCDAIKLSLANLNRAKEWQFNENSPLNNPSAANESLNGSFKSGELYYNVIFTSLRKQMLSKTCWLIECSIRRNEMRV